MVLTRNRQPCPLFFPATLSFFVHTATTSRNIVVSSCDQFLCLVLDVFGDNLNTLGDNLGRRFFPFRLRGVIVFELLWHGLGASCCGSGLSTTRNMLGEYGANTSLEAAGGELNRRISVLVATGGLNCIAGRKTSAVAGGGKLVCDDGAV